MLKRGICWAGVIAATALALAIPAVAAADTTIGITSAPAGATSNPCPTPPPNELMFEFAGLGLGGPLSVPSSSTSLVLTDWAINATGVTAHEQLTLVVFRAQTTGSPQGFYVTGVDTETLTPPTSPAADVEQFTLSQPIPVQAGDLVSEYAPGSTPGLTCFWNGGSGETAFVADAPQTSPPAAGETITPTGGGALAVNADLNLAATLSPFSYDAGVSLTGGPSNAVVGQPAVLNATVTNNGPITGQVTFTDPLPGGLTVESVSVGTGSCNTNSLNIVSCSIPGLGPHQSTGVVIVVQPKTAQAYRDSATVSLAAGATDPNPANDTATTTLNVGNFGAPTVCQLPKLGGASLAIVKRVLPLLGCAVGKTKHATSKSIAKGDVIATTPRAGSYSLGRKIDLTVSSGKPKPKKKKHKKK